MPIELPKGLPFSVDTWTPASGRKRYHFLTHAHRDHLAGIAANAAFPIYATRRTKSLVLNYFPQLEGSLFVEIEVSESVVIDDPDGGFTVSVFDANHCPGAVMFLFEGEFGNILHTGDCRLSHDCLQHLPMKYIIKNERLAFCDFDFLFLDCTFVRCSFRIPSKQTAIQQIINCIWKHPDAPVVYLACDMLGQEEILVEVSRAFGCKIYVDRTKNSECFHAVSLEAPEILSQDASSRFQVIEGFPRLYERASQKIADARVNLQPMPLFIRPSAQWYAGNDQSDMTQKEKAGLAEAVRDEFGVWHVCYSMHSSREELELALQLLQPKWVVSTTPPCRAMELDYVKKHCYKTRITADDSLWKLFKVSTGKKSASLPSSMTSEVVKSVSTAVVGISTSSAESNQLQIKELFEDSIELKLDLSPPSSTRPITLFGRARYGLQDTDILQEEKKLEPADANNKARVSSLTDDRGKEQEPSLLRDEIAASSYKLSEELDGTGERCCVESFESISHAQPSAVKSEGDRDAICVESSRSYDFTETHSENLGEDVVRSESSGIGSSKGFDASLRKLYRSMNVPVPRPLPSLVELKNAAKRVKLSSASNYGSNDRLSYCCNSFEY